MSLSGRGLEFGTGREEQGTEGIGDGGEAIATRSSWSASRGGRRKTVLDDGSR